MLNIMSGTEVLWWKALKKKDMLELAFILSKAALPVWNNCDFSPGVTNQLKSLPEKALKEIETNLAKASSGNNQINEYFISFISPVVQMQDGFLKFPYETKLAFLSVFYILKGMLSFRKKHEAVDAFSSSITRSLDAIKIGNVLSNEELTKLTDPYFLLTKKE